MNLCMDFASLKGKTETLDNVHKKGSNFRGWHDVSCLEGKQGYWIILSRLKNICVQKIFLIKHSSYRNRIYSFQVDRVNQRLKLKLKFGQNSLWRMINFKTVYVLTYFKNCDKEETTIQLFNFILFRLEIHSIFRCLQASWFHIFSNQMIIWNCFMQ